MHTEKQTFNINYLHWLHLHSERHQLSDLNKNCLGQIFVEI